MIWKKRNRGGAIVEMTVILPLCIIIIYLYIMYLLYTVQFAGNYFSQAESLYENSAKSNCGDKGGVEKAEVVIDEDLFSMKIVLRRNTQNPVCAIRRWQLAIREVS